MRASIYSLRNRLTVVFGGLSLVATVFLSLYIDHFAAARIAADRGVDHTRMAKALASSLAVTLVEREREIRLLVQRPMFVRESLNGPEVRRELSLIQKSYRFYAWVGVSDARGIVQATPTGLLEGVDVSQRPWFVHGLQGSFIGDAHESLLLTKYLPRHRPDEPLRFIDFAAPIIDAHGKVRGVVATHADWAWVTDVLDRSLPREARDDGTEVFIVDRQGALLHPFTSIGQLHLPANLPAAGSYGNLKWEGGERYLTSVARVDTGLASDLGWRVVIRQPVYMALSGIREFHRTLFAAGIAVTLLTMLIAYRLAGQFAKPVEQLAAAAEKVREGREGNVSFNVSTGLLEVRRLSYALRGMTAKLVRRKRRLEESNRTLEARVKERTRALEVANRELHHLARHDTLTGLPNRRAFNEFLHQEFLRMKRSGKRYAVVMVDIDHFKRVNDTWGHETGDAVLHHMAGVLRGSARVTDFVARLGGEEFIVILPETAEQADGVAEKIRAAIAASSAPVVGQITASLGVAIADPLDSDEDAAVSAADEALYQAKAGGRNRVVLAGAPGDASAG